MDLQSTRIADATGEAKTRQAMPRPGHTLRDVNLSFTIAWHGRDMPQAMVGIRAGAPKENTTDDPPQVTAWRRSLASGYGRA